MKKKQLISFISIFLCFFMFSGFFGNKTKKYIEAGDKAMMTRNYEKARENYRKAGAEGKEKLINSYELQLSNAVKKSKIYELEEVIDAIEKEEPDKALFAELLIDLVKDGYENEKMKDAMIRAIIEKIPAQYREKVAYIEKEMYQEDLEYMIRTAGSSASSERWREILDRCREMPDFALAQQVLKAYEELSKGATVSAVRYMQDVLPYESSKSFWKFATENKEPKTLDEVMQFHMAEQALIDEYREDQPDKKKLTELYDPNRRSDFFGINSREDSQTMTDSMVKVMKTLCGKNADGKIMFIHDRAVYGDKERKIDIVWNQMDRLPDSYRPLSVKEVKYLIYLKSDYTKGGTYSGGTQQIRESTKLSLYDTETGKVLYSKTVNGKTSNTMVYYGNNRPAYYSAESPDMCAAFQQCMKIINNQK